MYTLTPSQVESYHCDGFLLLRVGEHKLVDPVKLAKWTEEVKSWPRVKGKWMPYDEINIKGERQLMRTENFVDYHDDFKKLVCGEGLAGILGALAGEDMLLFKDKINYKQPRGNGFQAHLDAPAYDHIGRIEHITANFAIDPATIENGCLEVVPGSHKMNVPCIDGGRIDPAWEEAQEWLTVPLEAGDVLIFGSHLAHRSEKNDTDKARASLYATFHGKSDGLDLRQKYYVHRRANFPPDHGGCAQANYAAGNTFQDTLAQYHLSLSEKAVSLDLGLMVSEGVVAEDKSLLASMRRLGHLMDITQGELLAILDYYCDPALPLLSSDQAQILIGLETPAAVQAKGPLLTDTETFNKQNIVTNRIAALHGATSGEQATETVLGWFIAKIAEVLGLGLCISENWLTREFGVEIQVFLLLGNTPIQEIAKDVALRPTHRSDERAEKI
ncbi:hypothetical protein TCE0_018f05152 [Talaromyces pinophilus]|uniref:Ketoreductase (KR) domain-containing protein n=1 Tax=Talaromyces pinophilus TaxID=128442 RepID=A0A510NVJ0_TALPI|nr:hypothetical protein TCE0_018f05152 [Talaromyces pinophilus]